MPRPVSVIVFGTLNLVLGLFGLFGFVVQVLVMAGNINQPPNPLAGNSFFDWWQQVSLPLNAIAVFVQVTSGVGLLMLKPWSRRLAIGFAIYGLVSSTIGFVIAALFGSAVFEQMMANGSGPPQAVVRAILIVSILASGLLAYSYYGLMWYFLTRPHVIAAFRGEPPPVVDYGDMGASALAVQAQLPAATPSDNPFDAPAALVGDGQRAVSIGSPQNEAATMALYLGIGSLIPCVAIGLGPAAFVVGRRALAAAKLNPLRAGETQALLGMIVGGGCFLLNIAFLLLGLVFMVIGLTMAP